MNSRDETLALLQGKPISRLPVFSGLPSLTASGLHTVGVRYAEAHTDEVKMERAASSTYKLFGFGSAVVPFDLCVEAEALGARVDFNTDVDAWIPPVIGEPLEISNFDLPLNVERGRIPLVAQAVASLKASVGREIAIGAWIVGPFTLGWQLFGMEAWLQIPNSESRSASSHSLRSWDPGLRGLTFRLSILDTFADFLARVATVYASAGADFISVHEMGGSPQVIGPARFRQFVKPGLKKLFSAIPSPKVLSVCGDTNAIVRELAECGADAIHVDQRNDLARTRKILPNALLLGNLDPVGELAQGTPESIAASVKRMAEAGADAIWPGCDLAMETPDDNMRALIETAKTLRRLRG